MHRGRLWCCLWKEINQESEDKLMLGITRETDFRAGSEMISLWIKYPGKEI